ncbi:MAG: hypothetical protein H0U03_02985 [Actinobacteria bacterium]|nr:hypothetical protein [Actinomycetota bacterium]
MGDRPVRLVRWKSVLVALVVAASALTPGTASPTRGSPAQAQFTVKSSLDGKSVLPHRIAWLASPSLGRSKVARVDFLIDGLVRWTERNPPYRYANDDGFLVTTWLTAGRHRFQVRATAKDGSVATKTVVARVPAAPPPPVEIAGTWQRTIDTSEAPKPGSKDNPTFTFSPSGLYRITFEKRWINDRFPGKFVYPASNKTGKGFTFQSDYTATSKLLHVRGAVIFRPYSDKVAGGGAWCHFGGPAASYRWTVSDRKLTLSPVGGKDACGIRGFIWTGEWTRVG